MKKAEYYLEELFEKPYNLDGNSIESDFLKVIKQVQIDAIEETCKLCAENAECDENAISRQSILQCAEMLKKEINEE